MGSHPETIKLCRLPSISKMQAPIREDLRRIPSRFTFAQSFSISTDLELLNFNWFLTLILWWTVPIFKVRAVSLNKWLAWDFMVCDLNSDLTAPSLVLYNTDISHLFHSLVDSEWRHGINQERKEGIRISRKEPDCNEYSVPEGRHLAFSGRQWRDVKETEHSYQRITVVF